MKTEQQTRQRSWVVKPDNEKTWNPTIPGLFSATYEIQAATLIASAASSMLAHVNQSDAGGSQQHHGHSVWSDGSAGLG